MLRMFVQHDLPDGLGEIRSDICMMGFAMQNPFK